MEVSTHELESQLYRNEISKSHTVELIQRLLESDLCEYDRLSFLKLFIKYDLPVSDLFRFFENLFASDNNEEIRKGAFQIIVKNFKYNEKIVKLIEFAIKNEKSLLFLHVILAYLSFLQHDPFLITKLNERIRKEKINYISEHFKLEFN